MSINVTFKILTTDEQPIVVSWGDGNCSTATHNVNVSHDYDGGGPYKIRIFDPARVAAIIDNNTEALRRGDITIGSFTNLTELRIRQSAVETADLGDIAVETVDLEGNALVALDIGDNTAITDIDIADNDITDTEIDGVLEALDTAGLEGGTLDYSGNTGEAWADRSTDAQDAQIALDGKSWLITPATPELFWEIEPEELIPPNLLFFLNFETGDTPWYADKITQQSATQYTDLINDIGTGVNGTNAMMSTSTTQKIYSMDFTSATLLNGFKKNFGTTDFCFEGWFKFPAHNTNNANFAIYRESSNKIMITYTMQDGLFYGIIKAYNSAGSTLRDSGNITKNCSTGQHLHYYVQYDSVLDVMSMGINGEVRYSDAGWDATKLPDFSGAYPPGRVSVPICVNSSGETILISQVCFWTAKQYAAQPTVGDAYTPKSTPVCNPA